jgi:hypothetical protein
MAEKRYMRFVRFPVYVLASRRGDASVIRSADAWFIP